MTFSQIIKTSRPHFWLYEFGTYLIGVIAAFTYTGAVVSWEVILFGIYFLLPANILIYGINDVFDYETDMKNPKKTSYEDVLPKEQHKNVFLWVAITTMPFIAFLPLLSLCAVLSFVAFLFFAFFYSSPPIRAKIRPGLDSLFSGAHYVVTGIFGYYVVHPTGDFNWTIVLAALLWTTAMHAYSAVPDIQADAESGIQTVATKLGANTTLLLCIAAYILSFNLISTVLHDAFALLSAPYIILVLQSFNKKDEVLLKIYKKFSYLNAIIGMIFSIYLLLQIF
jgi:4-hydroxybenzoate polyprenyltransferase